MDRTRPEKKAAGDRPLVSVITPSYNQAAFIEETIRSVETQDYPAIEHIVIDGGSTDGTLDILKRHEGRLSWVSGKDRGQSDAINKGFRMAKGEVVTWLNSDDTYLPGAVKKAVDFLDAHGEAGMVYGKGYLIDEESRITGECPTEPFDFKRLARYNYIYQPSAFMRKEVLDEVGLLDEALHYSMDLDLWIRIAKRFKVEYLPEFLATYRLHSESKTVSQAAAFHKEEMDTFKRHFGKAPANWVYGYAYYSLALRRPLLKKARPLFFTFLFFSFLREYARQNGGLPIAELFSHERLSEKLKRSWDRLGVS